MRSDDIIRIMLAITSTACIVALFCAMNAESLAEWWRDYFAGRCRYHRCQKRWGLWILKASSMHLTCTILHIQDQVDHFDSLIDALEHGHMKAPSPQHEGKLLPFHIVKPDTKTEEILH